MSKNKFRGFVMSGALVLCVGSVLLSQLARHTQLLKVYPMSVIGKAVSMTGSMMAKICVTLVPWLPFKLERRYMMSQFRGTMEKISHEMIGTVGVSSQSYPMRFGLFLIIILIIIVVAMVALRKKNRGDKR